MMEPLKRIGEPQRINDGECRSLNTLEDCSEFPLCSSSGPRRRFKLCKLLQWTGNSALLYTSIVMMAEDHGFQQ